MTKPKIPLCDKTFLFRGEQTTLAALARQEDIAYMTLWERYKSGDREEHLVRNTADELLIDHAGGKITIAALSIKTGLNAGTLRARYKVGDREEHLVRTIQSKPKRAWIIKRDEKLRITALALALFAPPKRRTEK